MSNKKYLIIDIAAMIIIAAFMTGFGIYYASNSSMSDIFGEVADNAAFALLFLTLPYLLLKALVIALLACGCIMLLMGLRLMYMVVFKKYFNIKTLLYFMEFAGFTIIGASATVLIIYLSAISGNAARVSVILLTFLSLSIVLCTVWEILNLMAKREFINQPLN